MVPNVHNCLFRTFSKNCLTQCIISNHVKFHEKENKEKQEHKNMLCVLYCKYLIASY